MAVDSAGFVYVTRSTQSRGFLRPDVPPPSLRPYQSALSPAPVPGSLPFADAYVAKLDTTSSGPASLLYFTYLGGIGQDVAFAVAADASGNVYLTGTTSTRIGFPGTSGTGMRPFGGGAADAFVAKLNTKASGPTSLLYSTYLGGSGEGGLPVPESGMAIAVDQVGNAYVTGITDSSDFPTLSAIPSIKAGAPAFRGAVGVTGVTGVTSWTAMSSSTGLTATAVKAFAIYA